MSIDLPSKIGEEASEKQEQIEHERIALAADYLGYSGDSKDWNAELIAKKRAHIQDHVEFMRAFTDETRMDILIFLSFAPNQDGQLHSYTVSEIADRFRALQNKDITLSTISHHLQELKRMGIVKMEKHGKERYYQFDLEYVIERIGNWYKRMLAKQAMIRQGGRFCPENIEITVKVNNQKEQ
jgi:DNA-binding transcriptional ArsR family regulator